MNKKEFILNLDLNEYRIILNGREVVNIEYFEEGVHECKVTFCNLKPSIKGYCKTHYHHRIKMLKKGIKEDDIVYNEIAPLEDMLECKVVGCDRVSSSSLGMCNMHYKSYKAGNSFEFKEDEEIKVIVEAVDRNKRECKVGLCTLNGVLSGYCKKHYNERRYSLSKGIKEDEIIYSNTDGLNQEICLADNCEGVAYSKCLCRKHYRIYNKGKEVKTKEGKYLKGVNHKEGKLCSLDFCNKQHHSKGYCSKHYEYMRYQLSVGVKLEDINFKLCKAKRNIVYVCKEKNCNERARVKGLCRNHYSSERYGNKLEYKEGKDVYIMEGKKRE